MENHTTTRKGHGPWLVLLDDYTTGGLFQSEESARAEARRVDEVTAGNVTAEVVDVGAARDHRAALEAIENEADGINGRRKAILAIARGALTGHWKSGDGRPTADGAVEALLARCGGAR